MRVDMRVDKVDEQDQINRRRQGVTIDRPTNTDIKLIVMFCLIVLIIPEQRLWTYHYHIIEFKNN